jgi:hypothetical protein
VWKGPTKPLPQRKNLSQEVRADAPGSERRPSPAELLAPGVQRAGDDGMKILPGKHGMIMCGGVVHVHPFP